MIAAHRASSTVATVCLVTALFCCLLEPACGKSDPDDGPEPGNLPGYGSLVCDVDPPPEQNPCQGRVCFDACDTTIAVMDPPSDDTPVTRANFPRRARGIQRGDGWLASVNLSQLRVRSEDGEQLLAELHLPGGPVGIHVIGEHAFVQTGDAPIFVVDLADPQAPSLLATWSPQWRDEDNSNDYGGARPIGVSDGRLALWTPGGLSIVQVNDPTNPAEQICLRRPQPAEDGWALYSGAGDTFAVWASDEANAAAAWIYEIDSGATEPVATVELEPEIEPLVRLISDDILIVEQQRNQVTLLQLLPGGATDIIAQRSVDDLSPDLSLDTTSSVVGGLLLFDTDGQSDRTYAMDLQDPALTIYSFHGGHDTHPACVVTLTSEETADQYQLSPYVAPDVRYTAEEVVAHECPDEDMGATRGVWSPDGTEILFDSSSDGFWFYAIEDGTIDGPYDLHTSDDVRIFGGTPLFWIGDTVVTIHDRVYDQKFAFESQLRLVVADDLEGTVTTLDGPGELLRYASGDTRAWFLYAAGHRYYGDPPLPLTERELLSIEPFAGTAELRAIRLPSGAEPVGIDAYGDGVLVIDHGGFVRVLDAAGTQTAQLELPTVDEAPIHKASALGLFIVADDGRMWWVDPTDGTTRQLDQSCRTPLPLAADDDFVYLAAHNSASEHFTTFVSIAAARPIPNGDRFSFEVNSWIPVGRQGAGRRLVADGPFRLAFGGDMVFVEP